jgi:hypothetical protein
MRLEGAEGPNFRRPGQNGRGSGVVVGVAATGGVAVAGEHLRIMR